jgi:hypothetical protein
MFEEGNNCKIVYNRIRDTVAPFLATMTIGLYRYKPTIVPRVTQLLVGRSTVKLPRTRSDLDGLSTDQ